jgi:alpha-1,2-mannosyltransferase
MDVLPTSPARHWLDLRRLNVYCGALIIVFTIYRSYTAWLGWRLYGQPNGLDFVTFWAASRLTLAGTPLQAYSPEAITHVVQSALPHMSVPGAWSYPPNFLLLVEPLSLLPCPIAYLVFIILTSAVFVLLLRRVLPMSQSWLPILAFPGIWLNAGFGQNGCLTAALALAAFLLLKKRPVLAGVCIGMLSIKPHLAILFPVALACAGMWTTFIAAAATVVLFTGASIAMFGMAVLPAFLHGLSDANSYLSNGTLPWQETVSLFTALRELHVAALSAYVAQACLAIAATSTVAWVWLKSRELDVRAMALVAGTFLVSPYIYNYDTVWLGVPIALFTARALREGWLRWEREILCVAWLCPMLGSITGNQWHVGIGPLVFMALMFVAVRRTRQEVSTAAVTSRAMVGANLGS